MHDPSAPPRSSSKSRRVGRGADESTLVLRAQDGDVLAFAVLLEAHEPDISALCREILHHEAEAELIVQETFLTAWRRLDSLSHPEDFPSWLFRMAAHHSLFVLRNRHEEQVASSQAPPESEPGKTEKGVPGEAAPAQIRAVVLALSKLPMEDHLSWLLHEVDGQSHIEIADVLDVTPQQVRERIRRAQRAVAMEAEG